MDTIVLTNNTLEVQKISDLGIELSSDESINIRETFSDERIVGSADLNTQMNAGNFVCQINSSSRTYSQLIQYLTYLSQLKHENLPTLSHGLYKTSYFSVTKNLDGQTEKITHYGDENKTLKIREEVVNRDLDGRVTSITTTQYDSSGNAIQSSEMSISRNASGMMDHITTVST